MRYLLFPFSLLFMFVVFVRNTLFHLKIFKQNKLERPVICVGNLTTGGTGKTPWVQMVSSLTVKKGLRPAILSRGYSGDFSGILNVDEQMDPRQCGDEPLWLKKNTKADVFVGKNRYETALFALQQKDYGCFILDDGFQHRSLVRNLDIILLDASAPEFHYLPLPMGRMREPFSALRRSQIVVINKCNYAKAEQVKWLQEKATQMIGEENVFLADFVFDHWQPLVQGFSDDVKLSRVSLSCGVGNPEAFEKTVEEQGMEIIKKFIFPDHYFWKPYDIERMTYQMRMEKSSNLVITEKDAVKLIRYKKHFQEMLIQVWVCKMRIQIKSREPEFFNKIYQGLIL